MRRSALANNSLQKSEHQNLLETSSVSILFWPSLYIMETINHIFVTVSSGAFRLNAIPLKSCPVKDNRKQYAVNVTHHPKLILKSRT